MRFTFIHSALFTLTWKLAGLEDEELRELEKFLIAQPDAGAVIPGSGGVRKMRFAPASMGMGRRGALRVCYSFFPGYGCIFLVVAYTKQRKENLSQRELAGIKLITGELHRKLMQQRNENL